MAKIACKAITIRVCPSMAYGIIILLPEVPADAVSFEETGEEGDGISENHEAHKDQQSPTHKRHPTEIRTKILEVTQEGIHPKGRQEKRKP